MLQNNSKLFKMFSSTTKWKTPKMRWRPLRMSSKWEQLLTSWRIIKSFWRKIRKNWDHQRLRCWALRRTMTTFPRNNNKRRTLFMPRNLASIQTISPSKMTNSFSSLRPEPFWTTLTRWTQETTSRSKTSSKVSKMVQPNELLLVDSNNVKYYLRNFNRVICLNSNWIIKLNWRITKCSK